MRLKLLLFGIVLTIIAIITIGCVQKKVVPNTCDFPEGIDCSNLKITKDTISFHITNNFDEDISSIVFMSDSCDNALHQGMGVGDVKEYTITNCNYACKAGCVPIDPSSIEEIIVIKYSLGSSIEEFVIRGTIKGTVE